MRTDGLIKSFDANGAVAANRLCALNANDGEVVQASAASDMLIGASGIVAAEDGHRIDVHMSDIAEVTYGGSVSRGDLLTSDDDGKAVTATAGDRAVGIALVDGVANDIGSVLVYPQAA